MRSHPTRVWALVGVVALCASVLTACGSNRGTVQTITGAKPQPSDSRLVRIYSSLPLHGPLRAESEAIIKGIELARSRLGGRAGELTIQYRDLDDSTKAYNRWNASQTVKNARMAASDPHAVFYIGELDSSATKLSLPILNQAGIVQVTPGSPYVGLTDSVPGVTKPGEPLKYYPVRNSWTLLRMVPDDLVEAAAGLHALKTYGGGCAHFAAASYGPAGDMIKAFKAQAKSYGMTFVPSHSPGTTAASMLNYADAIKRAGVGCFVLTGHVTPAAVALTRVIHTVLPTAMILGTTGLCTPSWTDENRPGPPSTIETFLYCTQAKLRLNLFPGSAGFLEAYRRKYGRGTNPNAYVLYGYEATEMAETAIAELGPDEDDRTVVRREILEGGLRDSGVLGQFSFDNHGDTTWRKFGLYRPGPGGSPKFYREITP